MQEFVPFGGTDYFIFLALVLVARAMDFLSTWIATPNLVLEANPLAKRLGWRWGIVLNIFICAGFAAWPLPCLVIVTSSMLVAARNFQSAWVMRSFGEEDYRDWMAQRFMECRRSLFIGCILAQAAVFAFLGAGLIFFSRLQLIPLGIGMGMVTYAVAVAGYSLLSAWRMRRRTI
jgi:hypothetical protein